MSAQLRGRILVHACTFGPNGIYNLALPLFFSMWKYVKIIDFINFNEIGIHYGTPSDISPIWKENFSTGLDLQPKLECQITTKFLLLLVFIIWNCSTASDISPIRKEYFSTSSDLQLNQNVKFGTSFDLFQCENMSISLISLTFMW